MECPYCGSDNIEGVDQCAFCEVDLTDLDRLPFESDIEIDLLQRPIGELAASNYATASPDTRVRDVIRDLNDAGHHCAVILHEEQITGILTARDILNKLTEHFDALADDPVSRHMTPSPVTLNYDDAVAFGLNRMVVGGYRHIPVTRNDQLFGVVSVRNVLQYLADRSPTAQPANEEAPT